MTKKNRKQEFVDVTFLKSAPHRHSPQDAVVRNVARLRAEVRENARQTRALAKSLGQLARAHATLSDHLDVVVLAVDAKLKKMGGR